MLTIGAFSRISKVSPNALRYYDEIGLLKPAQVSCENGYRYYDAAQLETILLINKLKTCRLSLEEISEVLRNPEDNGLLLTLLEEKRIAAGIAMHSLNYAIKQMEQHIHHLKKGIPVMACLDLIEIKLRQIPAQNILYIRTQMGTNDVGLYLAQLNQIIAQHQLTITGPPLNVFHIEEEFNPECYDNELAIPVLEAAAGTRILPGSLCAMATLNGPYTELSGVYAKLQQWVDRERYTPVYNAYEVYVTNPLTTAPEENITDVYFPVKR